MQLAKRRPCWPRSKLGSTSISDSTIGKPADQRGGGEQTVHAIVGVLDTLARGRKTLIAEGPISLLERQSMVYNAAQARNTADQQTRSQRKVPPVHDLLRPVQRVVHCLRWIAIRWLLESLTPSVSEKNMLQRGLTTPEQGDIRRRGRPYGYTNAADCGWSTGSTGQPRG